MSYKVLMLGWELPPHSSGGLGVACYGLAKALSGKGASITFVLPKKIEVDAGFMDVIFADIKEVDKLSGSYTYSSFGKWEEMLNDPAMDYVQAALLYGKRMRVIAKKLNVDLIHCHDWLTFPAAMAAKEVLGKPLITHVHATEFDRTGGNYPNPYVYDIEKRGMEVSDKVISVSDFTKRTLVGEYGIDPSKIEVVHNGVTEMKRKEFPKALTAMRDLGYKVVLYHGRISLQKGPEYFLQAAQKVLHYEKKVVFVVSGSGDMQGQMMQEAVHLGIMDNVIFTGALWGDDAWQMMQSSDLLVMPSVSEPFGIVPLEAVANGLPTLISKQSGVSEVLHHCLKVDFWDTDEMANKILAVIRHSPLSNDLVHESNKELPNINWSQSADECMNIYENVI